MTTFPYHVEKPGNSNPRATVERRELDVKVGKAIPVPLPKALNTRDPLRAPDYRQRDSPSLIFSVLQLSLLLPGDLAHASAHKDP